jgi:hypothetical protein
MNGEMAMRAGGFLFRPIQAAIRRTHQQAFALDFEDFKFGIDRRSRRDEATFNMGEDLIEIACAGKECDDAFRLCEPRIETTQQTTIRVQVQREHETQEQSRQHDIFGPRSRRQTQARIGGNHQPCRTQRIKRGDAGLRERIAEPATEITKNERVPKR